MEKLPQISNAEYKVMDIIWRYAPISTNEIVGYLADKKEWNPKTIQTMLSRLEKKGVIIHKKEGRVFVYSPAINKSEYRKFEEKIFLNRFFDGALNQLVVSYLNHDDLTDDDLNDLQMLLDKKRKK